MNKGQRGIYDGSNFRFLYPDEMPLLEKFEHLEKPGFGKFPICMAK